VQVGRYHSKLFIYPVGLRTARFYWSMRVANARCRYMNSIQEVTIPMTANETKPEFLVTVQESSHEDVTFRDSTAKRVWHRVLETIEILRRQAHVLRLFPSFLAGDEMFGLGDLAVLRVLESVPHSY